VAVGCISLRGVAGPQSQEIDARHSAPAADRALRLSGSVQTAPCAQTRCMSEGQRQPTVDSCRPTLACFSSAGKVRTPSDSTAFRRPRRSRTEHQAARVCRTVGIHDRDQSTTCDCSTATIGQRLVPPCGQSRAASPPESAADLLHVICRRGPVTCRICRPPICRRDAQHMGSARLVVRPWRRRILAGDRGDAAGEPGQ